MYRHQQMGMSLYSFEVSTSSFGFTDTRLLARSGR